MILAQGVRRTTPRTVCRKGLHPLVPLNVRVEANGARRCIECYVLSTRAHQRKLHPPLPSESGWCRKRLHRWIAGNIIVERRTGAQRCKLCRRAAQFNYQQGKRVPCLVSGCRRATARRSPGNYLCPEHRQAPPEWVQRFGLRIVATQLVAAERVG